MSKPIDTLDQLFVNSPFKKLMLQYFEFYFFKKFLQSMSLSLENKSIIEAGCGAGYGLKLIYKNFHPESLTGFDILPEELELARKRNIPAKLLISDITNINLRSSTYDATFVLTVLHHVPDYSKALKEIHRILKPGGILLIDDLNKRAIDFFRIFLRVKHPKKARFEWFELYRAIKDAGFKVLRKKIFFIGFGLFLLQKI